MTTPKFAILGGVGRLSMIAMDLDDGSEALALAQRLADHTGHAVSVHDEAGNLLDIIAAPAKH